ncbi:MAG: sel1 repeat family protein [Magnetococcales bacterium]|nr:sel1 repeat family protein [Magnetococcales bacterium]
MKHVAHALVVIAVLAPFSVLGLPEVQDIAVLRHAAEHGDPKAQMKMGGLYHEGQGVPQSDAEAAKWYLMAAKRGDPGAQTLLALMLALGEGVQQDDKLADYWFRKAASQSDTATRLQLETLRMSVKK